MSGIDISGAIGVTFNAENPATNYRTGDELHIEWAVSKTFTPKFSAGLTGYYYDQISGDSGAVLGGRRIRGALASQPGKGTLLAMCPEPGIIPDGRAPGPALR